MSAVRLVVVSAGLSNPSSTRLLADQLTTATTDAFSRRGVTVEVTVVELREHTRSLADNLLTGFPSGDLAQAVEEVRRADALIAVTPVFSASYSGLFKTFFDVLEPELLKGKPVLMGATAGTSRHSLVVEHAMRPLFAYLKAVALPTAVFAATEDFGGERGAALTRRAEVAGEEMAELLGGTQLRSGWVDPFEDPVPFETMLDRLGVAEQ